MSHRPLLRSRESPLRLLMHTALRRQHTCRRGALVTQCGSLTPSHTQEPEGKGRGPADREEAHVNGSPHCQTR